MKIHYLDNSATTKPSETACRAFSEALAVYGNPSSVHSLGAEAARLLEASREKVALAVGVRRLAGGALTFTSSGTEANCLCLLGFDAAKNRARGGVFPTILISDSEHPSIAEPAARLEKKGYSVFRIPTCGGVLDMGALYSALAEARGRGGVALASFMLVNNETGALYDVKAASAAVHAAYPNALIHCDAVQGFMKTKFTPASLGVDALTVSAHKIHAPRGTGALYISPEIIKRRDLAPIIPGGGQEGRLRSGTENLCAIAAFAAAAEEYRERFSERCERISFLRSMLEDRISRIEGIKIKKPARYVPGIVNITLPRIKSETALNFLSGKGICVSAGSACAASAGKVSSALLAFGASKEEADSSVRISLGYMNDEDDIAALAEALSEAVDSLQRF